MTGKELMRHLHMGCGEPLRTEMIGRQPVKKASKKDQDKRGSKPVSKTHRSC